MEKLTRNAPFLLLALAMAVAAALVLALTWDLTFIQDTWALLMERRDITAYTVLHPHNEHIAAFLALIEQLQLRVFGMESARPEFILMVVALLASALLFFVYVGRRVGPWLALFATVLLLFFGSAWETILWPFEIGFVGSVLFGIATLLALEREDRLGDVVACASLVLALGFSSLGLVFVAAAATAIALGDRDGGARAPT